MVGKGRKKLENKLIENPSSRMVCFSKRRKGLLKKAKEISVLTGANVSVLTFSQAGKLYCSDTQAFDSLLCPELVDISSENESRESTLAETMAAHSIHCPQPEMSAETEVEEDASGSAFAEAMVEELFSSEVPTLNPLLFPEHNISSEEDASGSSFVEAMVEEMLSSEEPTLNSLLFPQHNISSEEEASGTAFAEAMVEEMFSSEVPNLNSLLFPEHNISSEKDVWKSLFPAVEETNLYCSEAATIAVCRETEATNSSKFDYSEAMAGKELPFWYSRLNVQAMGCEELLRMKSAIMEYRQMLLSKKCYR